MTAVPLATAAAAAAAAATATSAASTATSAASTAATALAAVTTKVDEADALEAFEDGAEFVPTLPAAAEDTTYGLTNKTLISFEVDEDGYILFPTTEGVIKALIVGDTIGGGTAIEGVPGAPTAVEATAGVLEADVEWLAPADPGDSSIINYNVQKRIGSGAWTTVSAATSTALTRTITGLTAVSHTARVRAVNTQGPGPWSDPSDPFTPLEVGADYSEDFEGSDTLTERGFTADATSPAPTITGGNLVGTGTPGFSDPRLVVYDFGTGDGHWTWHIPSGKIAFPVVRFVQTVDTVKFYRFEGNVVRLVDYYDGVDHGGTDTPTASYPETGAYTIECVAAGSTITWYINGAQASLITGALLGSNVLAGMDVRSTDHAISLFEYSSDV